MTGLATSGINPVKAAAFDTRTHGSALLTGRASAAITRQLRAHGFEVVAQPESFLVTRRDRLYPEEAARARSWGSKLASIIQAARAPRA